MIRKLMSRAKVPAKTFWICQVVVVIQAPEIRLNYA
jgi:hypothetical protein